MKRKLVITGFCLFVLFSAGWVLRVGQQQTRKTNTAPAPPLRVEAARCLKLCGLANQSGTPGVTSQLHFDNL